MSESVKLVSVATAVRLTEPQSVAAQAARAC